MGGAQFYTEFNSETSYISIVVILWTLIGDIKKARISIRLYLVSECRGVLLRLQPMGAHSYL